MNIEEIKLEDYKTAEYNPNVLEGKKLEKVAKSLEEFGYVEPIVVNKKTGNIVGGNHRARILKAKGVKTVQASVVELEPGKEKALNLLLNTKGNRDPFRYAELLNDLHEKEMDALLKDLLLVDDKEFEYYMKVLESGGGKPKAEVSTSFTSIVFEYDKAAAAEVMRVIDMGKGLSKEEQLLGILKEWEST